MSVWKPDLDNWHDLCKPQEQLSKVRSKKHLNALKVTSRLPERFQAAFLPNGFATFWDVSSSGSKMSATFELTIRPRKGWQAIDFKEIMLYWELLGFLVWR